MKKTLFAFSMLAMAAASAATSYRVKLYEPSTIGGTEVRAGDYKIQVKDNHAVLKDGKTIAQADVKVENGSEKYKSTTVRYATAGGKMNVQEIRLGGTNTKLVFAN